MGGGSYQPQVLESFLININLFKARKMDNMWNQQVIYIFKLSLKRPLTAPFSFITLHCLVYLLLFICIYFLFSNDLLTV